MEPAAASVEKAKAQLETANLTVYLLVHLNFTRGIRVLQNAIISSCADREEVS
jgi:hypothetical protein